MTSTTILRKISVKVKVTVVKGGDVNLNLFAFIYIFSSRSSFYAKQLTNNTSNVTSTMAKTPKR